MKNHGAKGREEWKYQKVQLYPVLCIFFSIYAKYVIGLNLCKNMHFAYNPLSIYKLLVLKFFPIVASNTMNTSVVFSFNTFHKMNQIFCRFTFIFEKMYHWEMTKIVDNELKVSFTINWMWWNGTTNIRMQKFANSFWSR